MQTETSVSDELVEQNRSQEKCGTGLKNKRGVKKAKSKKHRNSDELGDNDDESDSEITLALERIGVTIPTFLIPKVEIPSASAMTKRINEYLAQSVVMDKSSSSHIKEMLSGIINKRTTELKNLYSEMSGSFADIVNSNIDHPVDEYIDQLDEIDNEDKSSNVFEGKDTSNEDNEKQALRKELKNHAHLTHLTFEQFQDQEFLRRRIREILSLEIDPLLQRLLIQKLMSRSYIEKKNHIKQQQKKDGEFLKRREHLQVTRARGETIGTIGTMGTLETVSTAGTVESENAGDFNQGEDDDMQEDEVFLNEEDMVPTYYSLEQDILGCKHYQRNCKVECSKCYKWYTCRFCHDENESKHQMVRKEIKHILCMFCHSPQYPAQFCISCDQELSKYYCDKCKLFDNDPMKNIYHCDQCGICRLGLGLNQDYFHCDSCNACISIDLMENHVCIENSTKSNCPICDEFMFSSHDKVVFMSCGHPIHENCYHQHTLHSYKCPTCSKTITNMELQFRMRDAEIKQSTMPEELKYWEAEIKCNDCGGMSRVPFHYLGHKCDFCHSYNTMQVKLIKGDGEDHNVSLLPPEIHARKRAHSLVTAASLKGSTTGKEEVVLAQNKLSAAEKFISESLKQNFEFDQVKDRLINNTPVEIERTEEDNSIDHDYVNNFRRVINNFETYSSIGDAFKDWINASLDAHFSPNDYEEEDEENDENDEIEVDENDENLKGVDGE